LISPFDYRAERSRFILPFLFLFEDFIFQRLSDGLLFVQGVPKALLLLIVFVFYGTKFTYSR